MPHVAKLVVVVLVAGCSVEDVAYSPGTPDAALIDGGIDAAPTATLVIALGGAGHGVVTSDPAGIACGATCRATFGAGTQVTLVATPGADNEFTGWGGACSGTSTTCTLTLGADTRVDAEFQPTRHTVTVAISGNGTGTVVSSPAGIDCGAVCSILVPHGTTLTLTAAAQGDAVFLGWSGGGCTGTSPCTIDVTGDVAVSAAFGLRRTVVVTRTGNGSGGVTSNPTGINCGTDCDEIFPVGTRVVLTATASVSSTFEGWSGGGCSGTGTCTVTVDSAVAINAHFALRRYPLTAIVAGSGSGVITSSPPGITCGADCSEVYDHGSAVTLVATPDVASRFAGWSGACSGRGACIVTVTAATTVTATFDVTEYPVSVTVSGPGRVTSTPPGIDCTAVGEASCRHGFAIGASVVLAVTEPATVRWSGACAGNGDCALTVSAARAVTAATFAPLITTFNEDGSGPDACGAVAAGPSDAIVLAGQRREGGVFATFVRAYDAVGHLMWSYNIKYSDASLDRAHDVVALSDGSAVVAGSWYSSSNTRHNYLLAKRSSSGLGWTWEGELVGDDANLGVAVDSTGALIVAGYQPDIDGSARAWLRKLDSGGGNPMWQVFNNTSGHDTFNKVALDSANNVIAVSHETGPTLGRVGRIQKFASNGAFQWSRYLLSGGPDDDIFDVAVAADGHIAIVAKVGATSSIRIYEASGLNEVIVNGDAVWRAVAFDRAGNVVVAGTRTGQVPALVVGAYTQAGQPIWQRTIAAARGNGIAVDSRNNVLVCGEAVLELRTDVLVAKYYQ